MTQFDEPCNYEYWNYEIYFKFKRYISKSKYKVTSIDFITWLHEPHEYEYWNYNIYFKIKM